MTVYSGVTKLYVYTKKDRYIQIRCLYWRLRFGVSSRGDVCCVNGTEGELLL